MKRTFLMTGLAVLTLAFFMTGCNSMKKLQKEVIETAVVGYVNPEQLESVNGVVNFNYTINFAPKQFDKKMILKITPKIQYGSQMMNLQPMFLQGENVKNASYPVVNYDKGTSFTQKMSFNFKPGMENGVLWADIEAMRGNKSFMLSPVILNKNGIKVWKQPAFTLDGVNYVPAMTETFVSDVPAEAVGVVSGYVMFPLGKSTISQAEQNSPVMTQAVKAMEKVLADKNAKITNMFIYVSNSPEGAERLNKNLANTRFRSAKSFFEKDLKLQNTPMARNPKFVVQQTVTENWNGLYMLLGDSNIKNKDQIIKDLKSAPNATARNKVIDSYIAKIPELKEVILPVLRRADFFVFYTVPTTVQEDVQLTYFVPQLTEKTHRKCYVINFSDEAVALLVEDLSRDMPKLAEFLNKSFNGGTDVEPALREAAHIINGNDFRESDIVLISDFEMPPLSKDLKEQIRVMKRRKTSFFALSFGNQPEMEYLNLCDRYWEM